MTCYEHLRKGKKQDADLFGKMKQHFDNFEDEDRYLEEQMEIEREKNTKQERITGGW